MSRVLITGIAGFLGSHMAESLLEAGHTVTGTVHQTGRGLNGGGEVAILPCDILEAKQVEEAVAAARPEVLFHFAAQSLPAVSWRDPETTFRVNVLGTRNLLEAVRRAALDPLLVVAGSSAEYGSVLAGGQPIKEEAVIRPSSPYGMSKAAADVTARFYGETYRLKVIRVRPFLAIGPRKRGDVCSDFARGVVAVERGAQPALPVGNLDAVRDFLDVRDVVRALRLIADRGAPGQVYNVCSGAGTAVRDVLEIMLSHAARPVPVVSDPALLRPADEDIVIGDNSRLRALGWQPTIPLDDSLAAILDYWRQREAETAGSISQEAHG